MPRLVQKLPQYRRHAASGNAVVTLSGVDHYLGKHGSKASRVLYDRLLAEWLINGRATAATSDAAPLTIVELSARYWRFAVGLACSPNSDPDVMRVSTAPEGP